MKRDEMLQLRKETFDRVKEMRALGDYGAGARDNRENGEAVLRILDHLLERLKA